MALKINLRAKLAVGLLSHLVLTKRRAGSSTAVQRTPDLNYSLWWRKLEHWSVLGKSIT
jgi:hypothetical protein